MGNSNSTSSGSSLPNDNRINQLFFLDKCKGKTGSEDSFYEWCSSVSDVPNNNSTNNNNNNNSTINVPKNRTTIRSGINQMFQAKCSNIYGARGDCDYYLTFNNTRNLYEREECNLGSKFAVIEKNHQVPDGILKEINNHCYYWLVGRPLPWWAILLIVLAIILVFSGLMFLAWKYWLKKRWQQKGSTLESRWTSTPVSSTSAIQPVPRPAPLPSIRPIGNTTSQRFNMNSGGSFSAGSRTPSARSGLSGSGRRMSGRGSASSSSSSRRKRKG